MGNLHKSTHTKTIAEVDLVPLARNGEDVPHPVAHGVCLGGFGVAHHECKCAISSAPKTSRYGRIHKGTHTGVRDGLADVLCVFNLKQYCSQ